MRVADNFDYIFKFLIIGSAGSGKTCILRRFTEGKFIPNMAHTIGAEFGSKLIKIDETVVKIQIWDTAGQERFRSMARSYYHDAVGALLVYDITNRDSFHALGQWLSDAKQLAAPEIIVMLVGNKIDLKDDNEQVSQWEARSFAEDNNLQFLLTSALTGDNVDDAFTQCTRAILSKLKAGDLDPARFGSTRPRTAIQLTSTSADLPPVMTNQPHLYEDESTMSYECTC